MDSPRNTSFPGKPFQENFSRKCSPRKMFLQENKIVQGTISYPGKRFSTTKIFSRINMFQEGFLESAFGQSRILVKPKRCTAINPNAWRSFRIHSSSGDNLCGPNGLCIIQQVRTYEQNRIIFWEVRILGSNQ